MDLLNEVNAFLLTKTTPYAAIKNNVFTGESSEEIICRSDPSEPVVQRYLDGSEEGEQTFSYYAKSKNQATARNQCETFRHVLDLAEMQQLTGAVFGKIEPISAPVFVSKTDAGEYEYSVSFRLEYYISK